MRFLNSISLLALVGISTTAFGGQQEKVTELRKYRGEVSSALREMRHCLPIYNGHLAGAQKATSEAIVTLSKAISALQPPVATASAEVKPAAGCPAPVAKAPEAKAPAAKAPESKKPEPAKTAPAKPESPKPEAVKTTVPAVKTPEAPKPAHVPDVKESQEKLRNALARIQKAKADLKTVEEALGKEAAEAVAKALDKAEAEATAAIAVHEKEG